MLIRRVVARCGTTLSNGAATTARLYARKHVLVLATSRIDVDDVEKEIPIWFAMGSTRTPPT